MAVVVAEPTLEEARPIFRLGVDTYHQILAVALEAQLHVQTLAPVGAVADCRFPSDSSR
ncbi:hypothetical protein Thiowin_03282 [Thiorhodovibrio winogradskyi]|uniref:Uncharacterized protein n=1 Tax=Thiorhodovibrio winogradskyi TaxID=77007 RepID=A0ABZ0SD31_9GAMM